MPNLAEKYRPKTFDEFIGQKQVVEGIKEIINKYKSGVIEKTKTNNKNRTERIDKTETIDKMPDLLFAGPPGTGKTSMAYLIARELYGDKWKIHFVEYNASDERGIDVVRNEIKQAARSKIGRIIFLDECDQMCLHPETEVMVVENGVIENVTVEELYNRKFTCISFDVDNRKIVTDIAKGIKSPDTMLYELELEDGRKVICSANQPFFVIRNGKIVEVKLSELKPGDKVITIKV